MGRMVRAVVAVAVVGLSFACSDASTGDLDNNDRRPTGGENLPPAGEAYPGARDSVVTEVDGLRETYFRSDDSIEQVFAFFDNSLQVEGWNVTDQRTTDGRMEGSYLSGNRSMYLEVLREEGDLYRVHMEAGEVTSVPADEVSIDPSVRAR